MTLELRKIKDIHWLAGILEGEGCFTQEKNGSIRLFLVSTDKDIVDRAKNIMNPIGGIVNTRIHKDMKWKTCYIFRASGKTAIQWMMTLYPLMGIRRKARIKEILLKWKTKWAVEPTLLIQPIKES